MKARILTALAVLGAVPGALFAQTWSVEAGLSQKQIELAANGDLELDGHCFGNVATLPSGGVANFYGKAVSKDGNLYFKGAITDSASPVSGPGRMSAGSFDMAALDTNGNLSLAGTCVNNAGCSNTRWQGYSHWTNWTSTQFNNNCYNYANDKITNTFAQPGRAAGRMYSSFTVADLQSAAIYDNLTWVGDAFPGNTYDCGSGHLVFLAVWPGTDYHWYRLDQKDGLWSHKIGGAAANQSDHSWSSYITNPKTADRGDYTDDGGFFCTCGGQANIQ